VDTEDTEDQIGNKVLISVSSVPSVVESL